VAGNLGGEQDALVAVTAVLRESGILTIYPGGGGRIARRLCVHPPQSPRVEHRLGTLAACCANLIASFLVDSRIAKPRITLRLQLAGSADLRLAPAQLCLIVQLLAECDADCRDLGRSFEERLRCDPLFEMLTAEFNSTEIYIEARRNVPLWIC